ncbi:MAG: DapH/DapD/GlmU-related protein [Catalinimonas sp.]
MIREEVLLYGTDAYARRVLDCLKSSRRVAVGAFAHGAGGGALGSVPLHPEYQRQLHPEVGLVICVLNNRDRRRLSAWTARPFAEAVCHARARVRSEVDAGSVVCAGAFVQPHGYLGRHVIIGEEVVVGHRCEFDDFVHVGTGAVVCDRVRIDEGSWIGEGATLAPGVHVGRWARVEAGAVVQRHVDDGEVVRGVFGRRVFRAAV